MAAGAAGMAPPAPSFAPRAPLPRPSGARRIGGPAPPRASSRARGTFRSTSLSSSPAAEQTPANHRLAMSSVGRLAHVASQYARVGALPASAPDSVFGVWPFA